MVSKTKTRSNSSALVVVASSRIEFNLSNPIQTKRDIKLCNQQLTVKEGFVMASAEATRAATARIENFILDVV